MTHSNEFPKFYNIYKTFQIYDLKLIKNKLFYLIIEIKTMSIWRNQPLKHILLSKPITTLEENFITELTIKLLDHLSQR